MSKPKAINSKKTNNLLKEIGEALLDMIGGTIASKAGCSILLIVLGCVFIFSPIVGQPEKPNAFYILGVICLVSAAYLLISRAIEIRKEKNR